MIAVGQIWRDTHGDTRPGFKGRPNQRTVRVTGRNDDGRWTVVGVTGPTGGPIRTIRRTKVSEKTLRAGYVLVQEAADAT